MIYNSLSLLCCCYYIGNLWEGVETKSHKLSHLGWRLETWWGGVRMTVTSQEVTYWWNGHEKQGQKEEEKSITNGYPQQMDNGIKCRTSWQLSWRIYVYFKIGIIPHIFPNQLKLKRIRESLVYNVLPFIYLPTHSGTPQGTAIFDRPRQIIFSFFFLKNKGTPLPFYILILKLFLFEKATFFVLIFVKRKWHCCMKTSQVGRL